MIKLSVILRSRLNTGARTVVAAMEAFNEVYDNALGELPCPNTIDTWVRKCGLDTYNGNALEIGSRHYCEIMDESMMIGSNKLVLTLAAPSRHSGRPLSHGDVSVIGIDTAESFNARRIYRSARRCAEKVGHAPDYVITDNANIMKKGISDAGFRHHADISHSLGMFLERTYKNEADFMAYCKRMSNAQFQHNMRRTAYLLPPRQRTVARVINLGSWVRWSLRVMEAFPRLQEAEKEALGFVPEYASLVEELSEVMSCVRFIENECKQNGLSKHSLRTCVRHLRTTIMQGSQRMRQLAVSIANFLEKEAAWLGEDEIHNNSSDIIESAFGIYKGRKSPNKLYGVTSMVLMLPLFGKLAKTKTAETYDFKQRLENVKVQDIRKWEKQHLPDNLVAKREKILSETVGF